MQARKTSKKNKRKKYEQHLEIKLKENKKRRRRKRRRRIEEEEERKSVIASYILWQNDVEVVYQLYRAIE